MVPNKPHWQAVIPILMVAFIASCSSSARNGEPPVRPATDVATNLLLTPSPATSSTGSPATDVATNLPPTPSPAASSTGSPTPQDDILAGFRFPTEIEPTERYMFYIHGRILEDQGIPAVSPVYGAYRYEDILRTLQSYGFVVISEQRPKNANGWEYAQKTARQVTELLAAGVAPGSITVVGASKGASIATVASYLVGNPEVNYVLLGTCHPTLVDEWIQGGLNLSGNVLAIYDFADVEYSGSCEELFNLSEGKGLSRHDELVLEVGTGHGILYEPLPEWVLPTVQWANQEW